MRKFLSDFIDWGAYKLLSMSAHRAAEVLAAVEKAEDIEVLKQLPKIELPKVPALEYHG